MIYVRKGSVLSVEDTARQLATPPPTRILLPATKPVAELPLPPKRAALARVQLVAAPVLEDSVDVEWRG